MTFLIDKNIAIRLQGPSNDFQRAFRHNHPESLPPKSVVFITRQDDRECDFLSLILASQDIGVVRIDSDGELNKELLPIDNFGRLVTEHGKTTVAVAWIRHFSRESIKNISYVKEETIYIKDQAISYIQTLEEIALFSVNRFCNARSRLAQIQLADTIGFTTPQTFIGYEEGFPFSIAKPIGPHWVEPTPGTLLGAMPKRLKLDQSTHDEPVPLLFQRYMNSEYELRCYVIDQEVIVFRVSGYDTAGDLWLENNGVSVSLYNPTQRVKDILIEYSQLSGCNLCAIDLLIQGGAPIFLECNVIFDWLFYEERAGTNIVSDAIARYLQRTLNDA
ncbi:MULTISPECIES: ATP-grasp domain-containing protein [Corynebacterium]|uniref:ATP-grasp fold RimK-type domain-containing protein n=1 Tax=Corynebacterium singulare TaxID=161899 RepID=A0ABS9PUJ8_9CORY|nr:MULTISPECIES: hypothetical protein [Corynebacterium]MCG7276399.1 hypothetical protein [Corynebacterium singulare]OFT60118.1 hypothetical protein HMPREF3149_08695 [Corynebacterium sp. HMSC05E07]